MQNIEKAIDLGSRRALQDHLIPAIKDNDFDVNGIAYKGMDDHQLRDMDERIEARMRAFGWLSTPSTLLESEKGRVDWWEMPRGEIPFIHPMGSLWSPSES
jgi:hypothetical protein